MEVGVDRFSLHVGRCR